jgi:hypothetical protein
VGIHHLIACYFSDLRDPKYKKWINKVGAAHFLRSKLEEARRVQTEECVNEATNKALASVGIFRVRLSSLVAGLYSFSQAINRRSSVLVPFGFCAHLTKPIKTCSDL